MEVRALVEGSGLKIASLVDSIKDDIDQCERELVQPHTSQPRYWYNLDAQLMMTQLRAQLKELENCGRDKPVTADFVKPLVTLFDEFWERRRLTDAIFNINTASPENLLCIRIADYLRLKRLVSAEHTMQILMPTVERTGWIAGIYNVQLSQSPLHAYFPSQDGKACYQIASLEPQYNVATGEVEMIANVNRNSVRIAKEDCERLRNHSGVVSHFIALWVDHLKLHSANPKVKYSKDFQEAHQAFKAALNNPEKFTVTASYGNEGLERLKSGLLMKRNILFANREQLFDCLSVHFKPDSWPSFFKNEDQELMDFKVLLELVLKMDSAELLNEALTSKEQVRVLQKKMDGVITDVALFDKGEKYSAIVLYSLLYLYRSQREKAGKFTGNYTGMIKPLLSLFGSDVFPLEIKDEGLSIMQTYLTSSGDNKEKYAKYFTANAASDAPSGFTPHELRVLAAMKESNSTSSKLYKSICKCVPALEQKNELTH